MKIGLFMSIFLLTVSCQQDYDINKDFVFNSNGFSRGFTLESIKVSSFSSGIPEDYESTTERYDLKYNGNGESKTTIWFYKENENYSWTYNFGKQYKILPLEFEKEKWYVLWSNEFTNKLKGTIKVFFIHKDSSDSLHIYSKLNGQPW